VEIADSQSLHIVEGLIALVLLDGEVRPDGGDRLTDVLQAQVGDGGLLLVVAMGRGDPTLDDTKIDLGLKTGTGVAIELGTLQHQRHDLLFSACGGGGKERSGRGSQ
jgi:hypothetical protein